MYHLLLVPVLAPNFCRRLLRNFFRCRNKASNKNYVTLLLELILFTYYYVDERNYCTLGFIHIYRASIPYNFPSIIVRSLLYSIT
jgi:hypothetical protein